MKQNNLKPQRSLVLIKPDAMQRGLAGEIIARLERKGLKIVAMKMLQMDKTLAQRHYAIHKGKAFFNDLVDFITSRAKLIQLKPNQALSEVTSHWISDIT